MEFRCNEAFTSISAEDDDAKWLYKSLGDSAVDCMDRLLEAIRDFLDGMQSSRSHVPEFPLEDVSGSVVLRISLHLVKNLWGERRSVHMDFGGVRVLDVEGRPDDWSVMFSSLNRMTMFVMNEKAILKKVKDMNASEVFDFSIACKLRKRVK